jgi:hypothetical protein
LIIERISLLDGAYLYSVMAALVPAIRALSALPGRKTWMPGTRPGMTPKLFHGF